MPAMAALCVMTAVVVPSSRLTRSITSSTTTPVCDVERPGRLVAQQHVGPLGDRPRDRHALLLAAGQLRREVVQPLAQADQLAAPPRAASGRGDLGDQGDVLARGQAGDQVVELEHEADVLAAVAGQRGVVGGGQVVVAVADGAGGRHVEPAEDVQQRRLAADPDGPSRTTNSPAYRSRSTPRSAWTSTSPMR